MTTLVAYFSLSVGVSFICSLTESVILSITAPYVALKLKEKRRYAKSLARLKERIDQPLAAILTLNTIANTVGAAGIGAQVLATYGNNYLAMASAILTITILIISEIIPKTLGALYWKNIAPFCTYFLPTLIVFTYPFVFLSRWVYKVLAPEKRRLISRDEMIVSAEIGANEGSIREKESQVIKNLLQLGNVKVFDIMTPRPLICAFNKRRTVKDVMENDKEVQFSRIPIYDKDLDSIRGVVHRYKLLEAASDDEDDLTMEYLSVPIHKIPMNISVAAALDQFIKRKEHIFIVVDETGDTVGLVSLEDTVETLLGVEIIDEFDTPRHSGSKR